MQRCVQLYGSGLCVCRIEPQLVPIWWVAQLTAELSALHHFVRGGDVDGPGGGSTSLAKQFVPAHLGATSFSWHSAAVGWQIDGLYNGDPERPLTLAPLAIAGLQPGDVLTSIDGTPLRHDQHLGQLLLGTVGQQVRLSVLHDREHSGEAEKQVVVVRPISSLACADLRYLHWEMQRTKKVETLGHGQIGYVHLRAMGTVLLSQFPIILYYAKQ
jgi:hypothetical protein